MSTGVRRSSATSAAVASAAFAACALAGVVVLASGPADALPPADEPQQGEATFYTSGNGGAGNCSYPPGTAAESLFVAVGPQDYAAGAACGSYLDVTGPSGSVRVLVTDQCPECGPGQLDLSAEAFARIADPSLGIVPATYQVVRDPPLPSTLAIEVKDGSNPWWIGFLVLQHGNQLASVELLAGSGAWVGLAHQDYNYWLAESGAGSGPFTLRVTDVYGTQVSVGGIELSPSVTQDTGVWMYGTGVATPPDVVEAPPAPAEPCVRSARCRCVLYLDGCELTAIRLLGDCPDQRRRYGVGILLAV